MAMGPTKIFQKIRFNVGRLFLKHPVLSFIIDTAPFVLEMHNYIYYIYIYIHIYIYIYTYIKYIHLYIYIYVFTYIYSLRKSNNYSLKSAQHNIYIYIYIDKYGNEYKYIYIGIRNFK